MAFGGAGNQGEQFLAWLTTNAPGWQRSLVIRHARGLPVGVGAAVDRIRQEPVNRRIGWPLPAEIAVRTARWQQQIVFQEPQQRLACAAELGQLREHQPNRFLHAASGVLFPTLIGLPTTAAWRR